MKSLFYMILFYLGATVNSYATAYVLTVDSPTVNETVGTFNINIRIEPKLAPSDIITITYKTENSTAVAGSDFNAVDSSIIINSDYNGPQSTDFSIPITIIDDAIQEIDENFKFKIESATVNDTTRDSVTVSTGGGLITIKDNDTSLPTLSINDVTVAENGGSAAFTVSLSVVSTSNVTFTYSTDDITATGGSDYSITSGTGTIVANTTSTVISIPIINDLQANEGSETFSVFIGNPVNATISDSEGIGTIIDDDTGRTATVNDASIAEGDVNSTVTVKVLFSEATTTPITFQYSTSNGTATSPADYQGVTSATATVPSGVTEYDLTFTIVGDTLPETAEDFTVTISNITGGFTIADASGKVTIFDNDSTSGCSSYVGLMTINEYQNNPHYFDLNRNKITGNYVEIKYIDFLLKQYVTNAWKVAIYTSAGSQELLWENKDSLCHNPRYEVFQFNNNVMGAKGYVVLTDQNGNEVDVLNIDNSNHYVQQCQNFIYDTDFASSAQNKDLFRDPDGTGDWYDHGSGANSGGSRCEGYDSPYSLIFTQFDAVDTDIVIPDPVTSPSMILKTRVVSKPSDIKIISIDINNSIPNNPLIPISSTIRASLVDGETLQIIFPTKYDVVFNAASSVTLNGVSFTKAHKNVRVKFEYCEGASGMLQSTYVGCALPLKISYSRDAFAIRPERLVLSKTTNLDVYPNLFRSGEDYNMTINGYNYSNTTIPTPDYNVTNANTVFTVATKMYDKYNIERNAATTPSMTGTASFGASNFNMSNGVSIRSGAIGNEVAGLSFNNVGKVNLSVEDRLWSAVDNDDTPMNCNSDGTYICGELNATFIPHHFTFSTLGLSNNNGNPGTFTYIANEVDQMAGRIYTTMTAKNKVDGDTTNFASFPLWENNVTVIPVVTKSTYLYPDANETNITNLPIGFTAGVKTIVWNETNTSQDLRFNFKRDINHPANPFDVNGADLNITMTSHYADGLKSADINGSRLGTADANATFYYARARPSQFLYDDITASSAVTPIFIDVHCDLGFTACSDFGINTINGQIDDADWWLSWDHSRSQGDGNITLSASPNGSISAPPQPNIDASGGADKTVTVTHTATTLPDIVDINLITDDSAPNFTNTWLIYNPDDAILPPSPFYRVRFIGQSGWAGYGDTGHVVGGQSNIQKNKRLEW